MKWYFYNENEAINNLVKPYLITNIQPNIEELKKPHISSDIVIQYKPKKNTVIQINTVTKELVITYEDIPPTTEDKVNIIGITTEVHDMDINDMLYPMILDLDFQISEIRIQIGNGTNPVNDRASAFLYKKLRNLGGTIMTYKVLVREIRRGALTKADALEKIRVFELDRKLTKEQAQECRELAEIYCTDI